MTDAKNEYRRFENGHTIAIVHVGAWAYYRSPPSFERWEITHMPTGLLITTRAEEHNAHAICMRLHIREQQELGSSVLKDDTEEDLETLRQFIYAVEQESEHDKPTVHIGAPEHGEALVKFLSGAGVECEVALDSNRHTPGIEHNGRLYTGTGIPLAYARLLGDRVRNTSS